MVISLRRWTRWIKRLVVFLFCLYLFYQMIHWLGPWILPDLWRDRPGDGAVKVITLEWNQTDWADELKNRLELFYQTGE